MNVHVVEAQSLQGHRVATRVREPQSIGHNRRLSVW
jgi:hypothetical protein